MLYEEMQTLQQYLSWKIKEAGTSVDVLDYMTVFTEMQQTCYTCPKNISILGSFKSSTVGSSDFCLFRMLIALHIELKSLAESKTCFLNTFPRIFVVSCENYILGLQNFQSSLNRVRNVFCEIGQYGYQKIRIFTLILKV
jgi:hypothetical protein